jgi:hypothetical protein
MASEYLQGTTRQWPLLVNIIAGEGVATTRGATTSNGLGLGVVVEALCRQAAVKAEIIATTTKTMTKSNFRMTRRSTYPAGLP